MLKVREVFLRDDLVVVDNCLCDFGNQVVSYCVGLFLIMVYIVCEMSEEQVYVVFLCNIVKFVMVELLVNKVYLNFEGVIVFFVCKCVMLGIRLV